MRDERPRVALVGDSLTHFGDWPALLPQFDTINFGISGNTTAQVADRLQPVVQAGSSQISLLVGTNDIGLAVASPAEVVTALGEIIEILAPHARLVLHTMPPRQREFADRLREVNRGIAGLALPDRTELLDLWPLFDDGDGALRSELSTDGLHFNAVGYSVWATALGNSLSR
jgi:lysophospholipase L1-like esterase